MTDYHLTLPRTLFEQTLRDLTSTRRPLAQGTASLCRRSNGWELLALPLQPVTAFTPAKMPTILLRLTDTLTPPVFQQWQLFEVCDPATTTGPVVGLELTPDGRLQAWVWTTPGRLTPLSTLTLTGSGMLRLRLRDGQSRAETPLPASAGADRWSRLHGALGAATVQRLQHLHYTLIGLGRNGSLFAMSLARAGAGQMSLIDPDRVELHNLDAMDGVTATDIGQPKVTALHDALRTLLPNATINALIAANVSPRALHLIKQADCLISCVDHDGARLANAIVATCYHRPLLDIGSGITHSPDGRHLGGDIRLILPGEQRCLWCFGGFADAAHLRELTTTSQPVAHDWPAGRAGSLRSLNQINTHLGLRLLEDLLDQRITTSTWLRLEYSPQGQPSLTHLTPALSTDCPLCRQAGRGDDGLAGAAELARHLTQRLHG